MIHSPAARWKERHRFLPAVLAVAFSALLILLQFGLLLGLFSLTSIPIDHSRADLWVGHPAVQSCDLGTPIPEAWQVRVAADPDVIRVEPYVQTVVVMSRPGVRTELCILLGSRLDDDALGAVRELTPELRQRLTEPNTVVVEETDLDRLGLDGVGDVVDVFGHQVRVVGTVRGVKALTMPFLFSSLETAYRISRGIRPDQAVFVLAQCRTPAAAAAVAERLRAAYPMAAFTAPDFSLRTRWYWLTRTKAGISTGWTAMLGLLVGSVITSQTLYAATAAYRREFAVLRALGIPRWRIAVSVVGQAFWVGLVGIGVALAAAAGMIHVAEGVGIRVLLTPELMAAGAAVTLAMALLSSLLALRAVQRIEPAELLR